MLACGNTYKNGATGGEATHKLTLDEMPKHKHHISSQANSNGNTANILSRGNTYTSDDYTDDAGGDKAHNNMPPYRAVYVWERIS